MGVPWSLGYELLWQSGDKSIKIKEGLVLGNAILNSLNIFLKINEKFCP